MVEQREPRTLRDLATQRHERGFPTYVHVVGDFDHDPPKGLEAAKHVASLLVDDDGVVQQHDYGELDDGDVAFIRIDETPIESFEKRQNLLKLARLSRVKAINGIVVFTEQVDHAVEELLDARVWAESGEADRVQRLVLDGYGGPIVAIELDGIRSEDG